MGWLVARAGGIGMMIIQFLLTVIISAVLYANGDTAADGVRRFARRLGGRPGEDAAILAAKAVRGVALGVVVTAVIQSLLGGIGLAVSGVPAAALLTAVMFVLCVAQTRAGAGAHSVRDLALLAGPDPLGNDHGCRGRSSSVRSTTSSARSSSREGADLPLLLIFAGVIGGLIAFGVIGLFIGPVILAVTYTLL